MLSIRMKRVGKKHQPTYRMVVAEARSKLVGKFIEDLGWYNPHQKTFDLKDDRIKYWLGVGAKSSNTVHNLLVSKKVIEGEKVPVHKKAKKKEEAQETKATAPTGDAPVAEASAETPAPEVKKEAPVVEEPKVEEVLVEETPKTDQASEKPEESEK